MFPILPLVMHTILLSIVLCYTLLPYIFLFLATAKCLALYVRHTPDPPALIVSPPYMPIARQGNEGGEGATNRMTQNSGKALQRIAVMDTRIAVNTPLQRYDEL